MAGGVVAKTDPANLQPKVRKLNRELADYLSDTLVDGIEEAKLERTIDTLLSPWPRRQEWKLREVWTAEHESERAKVQALIECVQDTGIEPVDHPERYQNIDKDEVRLVCWLRIEAAGEGE